MYNQQCLCTAKERCYIFVLKLISFHYFSVCCCRIRSDHNEDNSVAIINEWLGHVHDDYSDVDFVVDESETGS